MQNYPAAMSKKASVDILLSTQLTIILLYPDESAVLAFFFTVKNIENVRFEKC